MSMKPGQCVRISRDDYVEAAVADLPFLDRMGCPRESDVREFTERTSRNWDLDVSLNYETGHYLLRKLR